MSYSWRQSMFEPTVSHLTHDGDEPKVSERYGDAKWVYGACGQNTSADVAEAWWMSRCMECLSWLNRQQRVE